MTNERHPPRFFALSESREVGAQVACAAGLEMTPLEERQFEGGEFKLRPLESVRGCATFVFESLAGDTEFGTSERLVRLLFLLGGLRDAGAAPLVAVVPYLAFARKDRRTQPRDPINSRYVAELIEAAGADRVVALDVHNPAAFDNAFRIPTDHLTALPTFASHFASRLGDVDLVVVSPDVGGVKRAQIFREGLEARLQRNVELAFIEKRRKGGVVSGGALVGTITRTSHVMVIDDLCATGGTLVRAATACREAGAASVHVAFTHAPLEAGIMALLAADAIHSVVTTDSVGPQVRRHAASAVPASRLIPLSIAPLFGEALGRMLSGQPLAPLLSKWP